LTNRLISILSAQILGFAFTRHGMFRKMLKSKIHRATITDANLEYQGSITIDAELIEKAGMLPFEFVDIWNVTNGARFETYIIEGERGSRNVCVNGAAARLVAKGDCIIIASSALMSDNEIESYEPKVVFVDKENNPI